jgi:glycosyltransferase involved in cell wall biosynthesis
MTDPTERIALAVVTRDRADLLGRHVLPGLKAAAEAGYPVVVVDQSKGDETRELLREAPPITTLSSEPGLSRGRNVAVAETSAELIAFTDDDVTLPTGWLPRLVDEFDRHPDAGAVCGRGVTPSGELLPGRAAGSYRFPTNPFGLGSGFNLAFRRLALADAGPFDEELGAGAPFHAGEDSDMLYRVMERGWTVVCSDAVTVVHHDWRAGREELRLHFRYGLGAGAQTAGRIAAGDSVARGIALHEGWKHVSTFAVALPRLRFRTARLQVAFLAGLGTGFVRRRRLARQESMRR